MRQRRRHVWLGWAAAIALLLWFATVVGSIYSTNGRDFLFVVNAGRVGADWGSYANWFGDEGTSFRAHTRISVIWWTMRRWQCWLPYYARDPVVPLSTITLPLWPVPAALIFATIITYRRHRMADPLHCRKCGYNLTGNVSGRCPECGEEIAEGGITSS
jgi:hypothetical protein